MNNAPTDPLSWYYDIPVVTRVYLTGAFLTTVRAERRARPYRQPAFAEPGALFFTPGI